MSNAESRKQFEVEFILIFNCFNLQMCDFMSDCKCSCKAIITYNSTTRCIITHCAQFSQSECVTFTIGHILCSFITKRRSRKKKKKKKLEKYREIFCLSNLVRRTAASYRSFALKCFCHKQNRAKTSAASSLDLIYSFKNQKIRQSFAA